MAGVAAAIGADNHARASGKRIGDFALAFVTPLSTQNDCRWHPVPD
jgi:hypothetical protein